MSVKLYVGSLSFGVTDDTLRSTFEQAGTVTSAKVIIDRDNNRSKGFGFVEFAQDADANKAIGMFNGQELDGRAMTVNVARPMVERTGGNRRY